MKLRVLFIDDEFQWRKTRRLISGPDIEAHWIRHDELESKLYTYPFSPELHADLYVVDLLNDGKTRQYNGILAAEHIRERIPGSVILAVSAFIQSNGEPISGSDAGVLVRLAKTARFINQVFPRKHPLRIGPLATRSRWHSDEVEADAVNSESDEGELMAARLQHAISQLMIVREFAQNIDAPVEAKDVVHLVQQVPMASMMVAGVQEFYGAVVGDAPTVRNNETAIPALAFTRRGKAAPIKGISFAAIEEVISRVADPRVVSLPFASPIPGHEAVVAKLRHIGRRVPLTGTANRGSITNNDDIANLHKLRPWLKPSESPCCKTRRPPQGGDGFHTIEFCENFPDVVLHRPVRSAAEHG